MKSLDGRLFAIIRSTDLLIWTQQARSALFLAAFTRSMQLR